MKGKGQRISEYQERVRNMVAPHGQRLSGPGNLRHGARKINCSRPPKRQGATAVSKCLRKREQRLWARQQDHASTINSVINKEGFRKPGRMK